MEIDLEKVDLVRERTNVSYAEAKEALEKNDGNVVDAIIYLEGKQKNVFDSVSDAGNEFVSAIKKIIKKGNVNRIKIKKDGKILLDIPVNAGVVGGAIGIYTVAPLMAIGAIAAVVTKVEVEIERPSGEVEIIKDIVKEASENVGGAKEGPGEDTSSPIH